MLSDVDTGTVTGTGAGAAWATEVTPCDSAHARIVALAEFAQLTESFHY
jgi:hypothetical protein